MNQRTPRTQHTQPAGPPGPACIVVSVRDLGWGSLAPTRELLEEVLALRPLQVTLDLSGCRRIDRSGVKVVIAFRRRLAARGGMLTLRGVPGAASVDDLRHVGAVDGELVERHGT